MVDLLGLYVDLWFVLDVTNVLVIIVKAIGGHYVRMVELRNITFAAPEIVSWKMDYSDRLGDWIITFSGKRFYPLDPRVEDIDIIDIAHSLSLLNRFTGHTRHPYSVAQHSLNVSHMVSAYNYQTLDDWQNLSLAGLLHDASEAYVNDLARPLKGMLPEYKYVEDKILDVIDYKFNVNTRDPRVKEADTVALVTEASQLCYGETWYYGPEYPEPFGYACGEENWRKVKVEFLNEFKNLGGVL